MFVPLLPKNAEIIFVWLRADKETRLIRKVGRARDDGDAPKWFEFLEKIYPDQKEFKLQNGKILELDVSKKTIDDVVHEVLKLI